MQEPRKSEAETSGPSDVRRCRQCGAILSGTIGVDVCPACALRGIVDDEPPGVESSTGKPHSAAKPRRRFGPYVLFEEIGRGGMGVVYRAEQLSLGRTVAIKLLLAGAHSSEVALQRFRNEASAAAGLRHPNIVAIHDYGEVDGQPYYTMDLIGGRNLSDYCGGKPLESRQAAEWVRFLGSAVQHAHDRGVLHRDLKPSNVIVDSSGRPYVTDFGLAKLYSENGFETLSGQAMGSPGYLAPEQARADAEATGVATDIYGLGALFYHLLTGRAPFNAATTAETFKLVLEGSPPSPRMLNPSVPRDLEVICLKCLEAAPSRRYATATALADDLDRFLTGRPIRARAPGRLYLAWNYARRHWVGVASAGVISIATLAAFAGFIVSHQRSAEKRASERARASTEEMIGYTLTSLQPMLEAGGRWQAAEAHAESIVRYYDGLSPDLYDEVAKRAHATALERLGDARNAMTPFFFMNNGAPFERAAVLWSEMAEANSDDVVAAGAALRNRHKTIGWLTASTGHQDGLVQSVELVADYRAFNQRFPGNLELQAGLGNALAQLAWYESRDGNDSRAVEIASEVEQLFDALDATGQRRSWLAVRRARAHHHVCWALFQARLRDESMYHGRKAISILESELEDDPGNVVFRSEMVWVSYWLARQAHPNEIDAYIDLVRSHTRELIKIHPDEPTWHHVEENMLGLRAREFIADRRYREAQDDLRQALSEFDRLPEQMRDLGRRGKLMSEFGWLATRLGDQATAELYLKKLTDELTTWASDPQDVHDHSRRRLQLWIRQVNITESLGDWEESEDLARKMVDEIVRHAEEHVPQRRRGYRPIAYATLGKALLMQGRPDEAFPHYEVAAEVFMGPYGKGLSAPGFLHVDGWRAVETFADLLAARGELDRATAVMEWVRAQLEEHIGVGGRLESRVAAARCSWKLAQLLDQDVANHSVRRHELGERAIRLLSDPKTEPRLLPEEIELRAEIEAALMAIRLGAGDAPNQNATPTLSRYARPGA